MSHRDDVARIPHSKDWSPVHPGMAVPTGINDALPCFPDCPRCLVEKLLAEYDTLLRMAYSRPSMPLSRAIKEVGEKPDRAYELLRVERDKFRLWASCGGVPTEHKCRVDGHGIYGGFISDTKGDICECHMMQEAMRELTQAQQEIASLKTEAERDKGAARLAFETLAEERDHLKAERERHIEAAAHKELDWFAEKRRADLLEAKCAEMASVLRRTRHRLLVMVEADGEDALYADEIKAVDATLKDNPGQPLLDRLAEAERLVRSYQKELSDARERWERTAYIEGVKSVYVQHDHAIAGVCGAACPLKLRDLRVAELERQLAALPEVKK